MPNASQGPKRCPNCNQHTRLNTSGTGSPRFCPYCAWGTKPIPPSYETTVDKPSIVMYALALIATPLIILGPYLIYIEGQTRNITSDSLIVYAIIITFLICMGFVFNPINMDSDIRISAKLYLLILIVFGSGAIVAFTIRSTWDLFTQYLKHLKRKKKHDKNLEMMQLLAQHKTQKSKPAPPRQSSQQKSPTRTTTKQQTNRDPVILKSRTPSQDKQSRQRLNDQYTRKPKI